jgi:hypothetical protein
MNDQDDYPHARNQPFTLRKSGERALLEFWHIGYGPDISYGLCVADPNLDRLGGAIQQVQQLTSPPYL